MTDYLGETFRATTSDVKGFEGEELNPDLITAMRIRVWDPQKTETESSTAMTWSDDEDLWYFVWDTSSYDKTGTYILQFELEDLDGHKSWEFLEFDLERNPVTLT